VRCGDLLRHPSQDAIGRVNVFLSLALARSKKSPRPLFFAKAALLVVEGVVC
jgi:hypothetical protein